MLCPFCQTVNREDRETCYVCGKDISTVRLLANKARQHYNEALEHAERNRTAEAISELQTAIGLDASLVNAHVVLGTLYAREGRFAEARACWKDALQLNPELARAHDYLERVESVQAALPTIRSYRRIALVLLLAIVALAGYLIISLRPNPGLNALQAANTLVEQGKIGEARQRLEQASVLAEPGGMVATAAESLKHVIDFDEQQRVRSIQDLKYRQLYPEALAAMAELQSMDPDQSTSASLQTIREDVTYYYRNMLSQLYQAYEKGDVSFDILQSEVNRFVKLYPPSPERDEIQGYINRAQEIEVDAALEEVRRRFAMDSNLEVAMEGIRELNLRFQDVAVYPQVRRAFIENLLNSLFNLLTGYLDQDDFVRAHELLTTVNATENEIRDMTGLEFSGVIEFAWRIVKDAQRQYNLTQIESLINKQQFDLAEDAVWEILQEPNLTPAETDLVRSYWRRLNRREDIQKLLRSGNTDARYFGLRISEGEASSTLELYHDTREGSLEKKQEIQLAGLAAASAVKLGMLDDASTISARLRNLDESSTVSKRVRSLIRQEINKNLADRQTTASDNTTTISLKETPASETTPEETN